MCKAFQSIKMHSFAGEKLTILQIENMFNQVVKGVVRNAVKWF